MNSLYQHGSSYLGNSQLLTNVLVAARYYVGCLICLYILSFPVLILIRIFTGVSIRRLGYLSLVGLSLELRPGIRVSARRIRLTFKRPTTARPMGIGLQFYRLRLEIDSAKLGHAMQESASSNKAEPTTHGTSKKPTTISPRLIGYAQTIGRFLLSYSLCFTELSVVVDKSVNFFLQLIQFNIDLRRDSPYELMTASSAEMDIPKDHSPLLVQALLSSLMVSVSADAKSHQVFDTSTFSFRALVDRKNWQLSRISTSLRSEFLFIDVNILTEVLTSLSRGKKHFKPRRRSSLPDIISPSTSLTNEDVDDFLIKVRDKLELFLSRLQEIKFHVSLFRVKKVVNLLDARDGKTLARSINFKAESLTSVFSRQNKADPSLALHFSRQDTVFKAMLSTLSSRIFFSTASGSDHVIASVPSMIFSARTNIYSQINNLIKCKVIDLNQHTTQASATINMPSIDIMSQHLPSMISIISSHFANQPTSETHPKGAALDFEEFERKDLAQQKEQTSSHIDDDFTSEHTELMAEIYRRIVPRLRLALTIEEPVIRFLGNSKKPASEHMYDYDRIIVVSCHLLAYEIHALHTVNNGESEQNPVPGYNLTSKLRINGLHSWFHVVDTTQNESCAPSAKSRRRDLFFSELLYIRINAAIFPYLNVSIHGTVDTIDMWLVAPEMADNLKILASKIKLAPQKLRERMPQKPKISALRKVPAWLHSIEFGGSEVSLTSRSIDISKSPKLRGATWRHGKWELRYSATTSEGLKHHHKDYKNILRRTEADYDDQELDLQVRRPTDGRMFVAKVHNICLAAINVEDGQKIHDIPVLTITKINFLMQTGQDNVGAVCRVSLIVPSISIDFSFFALYAVLLAARDCLQIWQNINRARQESRDKSESEIQRELEAKILPLKDDEFTSLTLVNEEFSLKTDSLNLMLELEDSLFRHHRDEYPTAQCHLINIYVRSPVINNSWNRLLLLRKIAVQIKGDHPEQYVQQDEIIEEKMEASLQDKLVVTMHTWYLFVPNQLEFFKVFEDLINSSKACKQLLHTMLTGNDNYILTPGIKHPRAVPRIRVRASKFFLALEDDPFESRLAIIFKAAAIEQKARYARELAFEAKVSTLKAKAADAKKNSDRTRQGSHNGHEEGINGPIKPIKKFINQPGDPFHRHRKRRTTLRYSPDEAQMPSDEATISIEEARKRLDQLNSHSWIRRIRMMRNASLDELHERRRAEWGESLVNYQRLSRSERVLHISPYVNLFEMRFQNLELLVDKPSFSLDRTKQFLHTQGKGMPLSQDFTLIIPCSLSIAIDELRINLRDYPLPLFHIPPLNTLGTGIQRTALVQTDLVIAEELAGNEAIRHIRIPIIPESMVGSSEMPYSIVVPRTLNPIKIYSDVQFDIFTYLPTLFTWGESLKAGLTCVMKAFDSFTKPAVDLSPPLGFWDKIRLVMHSRLRMSWKGSGDVILVIKGSRNPYEIVGKGSGLAFCWRRDVKLLVHPSTDPKEFMKVQSKEFAWAIPKFSPYVFYERGLLRTHPSQIFFAAPDGQLNDSQLYEKVFLRLSGDVLFQVGLLFQRDLDGDDKQTYVFKPHYRVRLRHPSYVPEDQKDTYDAYKGFRSDHTHLALSVKCPQLLDWSDPTSKVVEQTFKNTAHLTPGAFAHFFSWYKLFSGNQWPPVRAGPLLDSRIMRQATPKFGRHLATVKYQLLLSPLTIAHMYSLLSESCQDTSGIGLKVKLDKFSLDLHQRREKTVTTHKNEKKETSHMRFNLAQIDLHNADLRAMSYTFRIPSANQLAAHMPSTWFTNADEEFQNERNRDNEWFDVNDFTEVGKPDFAMFLPPVLVQPLLHTPRFTYYREEEGGSVRKDKSGNDVEIKCNFGDEPSHDCVIGRDSTLSVEIDLCQERLADLSCSLQKLNDVIETTNVLLEKEPNNEEIKTKKEEYFKSKEMLKENIGINQKMLEELGRSDHTESKKSLDFDPFNTKADLEEVRKFRNRFVVHHVQARWNNGLRNVLLEYAHLVGTTRGLSYYTSRRAVKFVEELVSKQERQRSHSQSGSSGRQSSGNDDTSAQKRHFDSDSIRRGGDQSTASASFQSRKTTENDSSSDSQRKREFQKDLVDVAENMLAERSYLVRLIYPQFQLISEQNPDSSVSIVSDNLVMKIISVKDKEEASDEVSGLLQTRFGAILDNCEVYLLNRHNVINNTSLFPYGVYGCEPDSNWPSWLMPEVFLGNPVTGLSCILQRMLLCMRYDKVNRLRISEAGHSGDKNGKGIGKQLMANIVDDFVVHGSKVVSECTSEQYAAVYLIVTDLVMYSEPIRKSTTERLEKLILATDFSNLSGTPVLVSSLQIDLAQIELLLSHFQLRMLELDERGWADYLTLSKEKVSVQRDLLLIVSAIRIGRQRLEGLVGETTEMRHWSVTGDQIIWHLLLENGKPFIDFALAGCAFHRADYSDGSNSNLVEIDVLQGLNLLPNSVYPELISPYFEDGESPDDMKTKLVKVSWTLLEPIGGIRIVESFEVSLHPMKVQLEYEVTKILESLLPGAREKSKKSTKKSSASNDASDYDSDGSSDDGSGTASLFTGDSNSLVQRRTSQSGSHIARSARDSLDSGSPGTPRRKFSILKRHEHGGLKDLDQMMSRADNYMSIISFTLHEVQLCISYKGAKSRNLSDLHEFVFTFPTIVYTNKTWSKVDLAMRLKKQLVKTLILHSGSLIESKLSRGHRNQRPAGTFSLRQISNYASFTSLSELTDQGTQPSSSETDDTNTPQIRITDSDTYLDKSSSPNHDERAKNETNKHLVQRGGHSQNRTHDNLGTSQLSSKISPRISPIKESDEPESPVLERLKHQVQNKFKPRKSSHLSRQVVTFDHDDQQSQGTDSTPPITPQVSASVNHNGNLESNKKVGSPSSMLLSKSGGSRESSEDALTGNSDSNKSSNKQPPSVHRTEEEESRSESPGARADSPSGSGESPTRQTTDDNRHSHHLHMWPSSSSGKSRKFFKKLGI